MCPMLKQLTVEYKKKGTRKGLDSGLMHRAIAEVIENGGTMRSVAKQFDVDRMTLTRYVKKYRDGVIKDDDVIKPKYNVRQVSNIHGSVL